MTNEELLLAYNTTDDQAHFNTLVNNVSRELTCYLARRVGWADAPDLLQLVLMRLLKYRHTYNGTGCVLSWLYAVSTRMIIDHKRKVNAKKRGHAAHLDNWNMIADPNCEDDLEPLVGTEETLNQIQQHVNNLPMGKRQVFESVYFEHHKLRETAKELDIPLGTVKSRLHAGVMELRQQMRSM